MHNVRCVTNPVRFYLSLPKILKNSTLHNCYKNALLETTLLPSSTNLVKLHTSMDLDHNHTRNNCKDGWWLKSTILEPLKPMNNIRGALNVLLLTTPHCPLLSDTLRNNIVTFRRSTEENCDNIDTALAQKIDDSGTWTASIEQSSMAARRAAAVMSYT